MSGETDETTCLDFGDECQVACDFYDAGYDTGMKDVTAILRDLIAELRELIARTEAEGWPDEEITYVASPFITTRIDRAEARLRGVTGE